MMVSQKSTGALKNSTLQHPYYSGFKQEVMASRLEWKSEVIVLEANLDQYNYRKLQA